MNGSKRARRIGYTVVALIVLVGAWLVVERLRRDQSVVVSPRSQFNPNVENGRAFDRAVLPVNGFKNLVLPRSATVRRTAPGGDVVLRIKKQLAFGGHPPEPMSIRDARHNMGCAVKAEGDALLIATFGDWGTRIEGGATITLVADVPENVAVEQQEGLVGMDSEAQAWCGVWLTKPANARGGYWYGPASPADDWAVLRSEPDIETAERVSRAEDEKEADLILLRTVWYACWVVAGSSLVLTWGAGRFADSRRGRLTVAMGGVALGIAGSLAAFGFGHWPESGPDQTIIVGVEILIGNLLGIIVLLPRRSTSYPRSRS